MAVKRQNSSLTIVENRHLCPGYYRIVVEDNFLARVSCPGQFCMLSVPGVFLRRPLSIAGAEKSGVEFIYRVIGKGTAALSEMKKGDRITVLGPLGNGYVLPEDPKTIPVLVAGGTGIASLYFLGKRMARPGVLFYGMKSKDELICLDVFKRNRWQIHISTDDGSLGYKGFVTELFEKFVGAAEAEDFSVYGCGPKPMLRKIADICLARHIPCAVSLEEMMGCGIGNCQGCAVQTLTGYKMACKDGPVFDAKEIVW